MQDKKYMKLIGNYRVEVTKKYRTKSQYEYFLNIYYQNSDLESIHLFAPIHLTLKGAFDEAERAIARKPKIEKVIY